MLLISTTGFSISRHYCGGDLVSVKLIGEAQACCDNADCCHTTSQFAQLEDDFVYSSTEVDFDNSFAFDLIQFPAFLLYNDYGIENEFTYILNFESPPPPTLQTQLASLQTFLL